MTEKFNFTPVSPDMLGREPITPLIIDGKQMWETTSPEHEKVIRADFERLQKEPDGNKYTLEPYNAFIVRIENGNVVWEKQPGLSIWKKV